MGVHGYFRIPPGDPILESDGKVLSGAMSVEVRREIEARKDKRRGARYRDVGAYDPVLRAHCRLDSEG